MSFTAFPFDFINFMAKKEVGILVIRNFLLSPVNANNIVLVEQLGSYGIHLPAIKEDHVI